MSNTDRKDDRYVQTRSELLALKRSELAAMAASLGVPKIWAKNKAELADRILDARASDAGGAEPSVSQVGPPPTHGVSAWLKASWLREVPGWGSFLIAAIGGVWAFAVWWSTSDSPASLVSTAGSHSIRAEFPVPKPSLPPSYPPPVKVGGIVLRKSVSPSESRNAERFELADPGQQTTPVVASSFVSDPITPMKSIDTALNDYLSDLKRLGFDDAEEERARGTQFVPVEASGTESGDASDGGVEVRVQIDGPLEKRDLGERRFRLQTRVRESRGEARAGRVVILNGWERPVQVYLLPRKHKTLHGYLMPHTSPLPPGGETHLGDFRAGWHFCYAVTRAHAKWFIVPCDWVYLGPLANVHLTVSGRFPDEAELDGRYVVQCGAAVVEFPEDATSRDERSGRGSKAVKSVELYPDQVDPALAVEFDRAGEEV